MKMMTMMEAASLRSKIVINVFAIASGEVSNVPFALHHVSFYSPFFFFFYSFRNLSRSDKRPSKFSSRWDEEGEEKNWMKESKKPEPDFFFASTITAVDEK